VAEDGTPNAPFKSDSTVKYMPNGENQLKAMTDILIWKGTSPIVYPFIKPLSKVTIPVARNAPLNSEFHDGTKMLQPLIFSHGLTSHKMNYSGLCREFASYGFLVIALNHNDRSCEYTTG
jgi:hypothetical protein